MSGELDVRTLLVGVLLGFLLLGLLVTGAYMMRLTPEVVNCDRGRQSVTVRVSQTYPDPADRVFHRKIGGCDLWFHGVRASFGGGD